MKSKLGNLLAPPCRAMGLLLVLVAMTLSLQAAAATASPRVVAVGDIHGNFDALVEVLQETGLMDAEQRWIGGDAILVQTGDFLDRGSKVREVMDLLMALEKQAVRDSGRVVVLLGNHEMMNLMGDLRDVAKKSYLSFVDENSGKRRQDVYQDYLELYKRRSQLLGQEPSITPKFEKQWMKRHPPGFLEYRDALQPHGKYGGWLRKRPAIVQIGDTIFLHGGIHPELASFKLRAINERIKWEIEAFDAYTRYMVAEKLIVSLATLDEAVAAAEAELKRRKDEVADKSMLESFLQYGSWLSVHPNGPLWFRGFAYWSEREGRRYLSKLLESYEAKHFVVGHTAQLPGRIRTRFRDKVFLVDTGMLSSFYRGGRASALEIQDGRFTAIYRGRSKVLLDPGN
ncbi:MAG: metallophosphoesterase [Acidobacteria bacterium]|nr:metallophosphoesterase [Acidobacteriota bacterium]